MNLDNPVQIVMTMVIDRIKSQGISCSAIGDGYYLVDYKVLNGDNNKSSLRFTLETLDIGVSVSCDNHGFPYAPTVVEYNHADFVEEVWNVLRRYTMGYWELSTSSQARAPIEYSKDNVPPKYSKNYWRSLKKPSRNLSDDENLIR